MNKGIPQVDHYLTDGCGRCKWYATPKCKVHTWKEELLAMRQIALESGLKEELKWSVPVYTYEGKNVLMINAFKEYACFSFFKGSLLSDSKKILESQGENSKVYRIIKITNADQVYKLEKDISKYIKEAVEIERSGKKVSIEKKEEPLPEELSNLFKKDIELKKAFFALTPGRQRGYLMFFNQAKQSATRTSRIESKRELIMQGKGPNDDYKSKK